MAVKGATEALVAAFTFGLVLYAATAALALYAKGHGTAILRDGQRLVLVGFLSTAALWALTDFISILLQVDTSSTPCQIGIIFATIFDQLARFSIEQYLHWAQNTGEKVSAVQIIAQLLILGRLVAGGVFVGFTRPQTDSFCVAASSELPISIVVISMDTAILLCLISRALAQNTTLNTDAQAARRKALFWVMFGLAIWTATSVTLHLGFRYVALVVRTALPAIGLTILIIILTVCSGTLGSASMLRSKSPEALSPRRVEISRDISTSDSYYTGGNYQDVKDAAIRSETTFINPREAPTANNQPTYGLPTISLPITGVAGMGGVPIEGQLFPPIRANTAPTVRRNRSVKAAVGLHKKGASAGGRLQISNPILQDPGKSPLNKIPTVDLQDAMRAERERREKLLRQTSLAKRDMTAQDPREGVNRDVSLKRKEVGSPVSSGSSLRPENMGMSSSTQLSPGTGGIRQRSPRQSPEPSELSRQSTFQSRSVSPPKDFEQPLPNLDIRPSRQLPPSPPTPPQERPLTALQRRPTTGLPSNPRARALKLEEDAPGAERHQTVLFLNNIIYDDPALVHDILQGSNDSTINKPQSPGTPESVVHRPRPIPRKVADPNPFAIPGHRRSKSSGSLVRKSTYMSGEMPPLPAPPKSAGAGTRPQPNRTRSMTVTEKIARMYPGEMPNKMPPVPEVPAVASSYLQSPSSVDSEEVRQPSQPTKTTTKTENIPTIAEEPRQPTESKYETDMAAKRASSPVIPVNSPRDSTYNSEGSESPDEVDTPWSSVRYTQVSVGLAVAQPMPRPLVKTVREESEIKIQPEVPPASQEPAKEVKRPEVNTAVENKPAPKQTFPVQARWVGDKCPVFSDRKSRIRMPPPSPLPLNGPRRNTVMVQAEPSPLESPEHALRQIQEQLKKFEEPVTEAGLKDHTERLALLEDLEKEMGIHENHWQEMKNDMGRDSLYSIQTNSPANRNSRCDSTVGSIVIGHGPAVGAMAAERRASRQTMSRNSGSYISNRLSKDAVKSHMSIWQKRLTEAHIDYMETAAERLRHPSGNFLPVPMPNVQLGSPTPPDSDVSGDDDSVLSAQLDAVSNWLSKKAVKTVSLWAPVPQQTTVAANLLWTPVPKASPTSTVPTPEAETFVRPLARKDLPPLEIASTQLWSKPAVNAKKVPSLWTPPAPVQVSETNALWVHIPKVAEQCMTPLPEADAFVRPAARKDLPPLEITTTQLWSKPAVNVKKFPSLWTPPAPTEVPETNALWVHIPKVAEQCMTPLPEADAFVRPATRKVLAPLEITSTHLWKKAEPEKTPSLWTPPPKVSAVKTNLLWSSPPKVLEAPSLALDLPEIFTRPAARKDLAPLQISSKHLWRKPYTSTKDTTGLWRPSWASVAPPADFKRLSLQEIPQPKPQKAPRPVTQRPPRRNKRVSALPDILENPEPLPNKRDTLGIFQFPWGEKSDTATMPQPRPFGRSAMPGTMSSGVPSLRASYTPDYSTSFFDEYDDEDPESDYERQDSDDEDDDFDETTLWEIASLLNSDAVPSRNSLFLSATPAYNVDEYYGGGGGSSSSYQEQSASASATDIDEDDDASSEHSILIGLAEDPHDDKEHVAEQYDHQGFLMQDTADSTPSTLDQGAQAVVATRATLADDSAPAPAPPRVETSENQAVETRLQISTGLWSLPESPENKTLSSPHSAETKGLFVLGRESTSDNRTTEQEPAAINMHRTPRDKAADSWRPLDKLMSDSLWTPEAAAAKGVSRQVFQHWITLSLAANAQVDNAEASPSAARLPRIQATPAEWDAALKEALIASGYPINIKCRTETGRITATPADWAAALEEAIQASIIKSAAAPVFNSAIRHPVFAGSSLITTSEWFHPAATGYTYDAACVHPVFFGSLAITCPEESVHPAMSAYAHKKLRRHQRSGSSASSTHSRKTSRSHSSSSGKKRRESIIAQIHAIEAEMGLIPEDSAVVPDVPEVPSLDEIEASRKAKIQAQIEALEQEKLFAAQIARESFVTRRRGSSSVSHATTASGTTTNSENDGPASMDSFPLSQRPSTATSVDLEHDLEEEKPEVPELTISSPQPQPSTPSTTNNSLWKAPSPLPHPTPSLISTLWTPTPSPSPASSFESYEDSLPSPQLLWQPKAGKPEIIAKTDEDREAHERRAMGRKGLLTKQRKAEILEQIMALESGEMSGDVKGLWKKSEVSPMEKKEVNWMAVH